MGKTYRVLMLIDTQRNKRVEFLATEKSNEYFSNRYIIEERANKLFKDEAFEIERILNKRLES